MMKSYLVWCLFALALVFGGGALAFFITTKIPEGILQVIPVAIWWFACLITDVLTTRDMDWDNNALWGAFLIAPLFTVIIVLIRLINRF